MSYSFHEVTNIAQVESDDLNDWEHRICSNKNDFVQNDQRGKLKNIEKQIILLKGSFSFLFFLISEKLGLISRYDFQKILMINSVSIKGKKLQIVKKMLIKK